MPRFSIANLERSERVLLAAVVVVLVSAFLGALFPSLYAAMVLLGILAAVIAALGRRTATFFLGFLFPFQGLRFTLPPLGGSFLYGFFPDGIDQSFGNLLALALLVLEAWRIGQAWLRGDRLRVSAPGMAAAAVFWLSGLLSVANAEDGRLLSVKYVLFPIAFSYIAFVWLPLRRVRGREDLRTLAGGMLAAGAATAVLGVLSLLTEEGARLGRVTPIGFFGVWPIGMNHNLLAETLVATAPLAFAAAIEATRPRRALLLRVLGTAMTAVALLTFARTAWIAFAFMAAVALFTEYRAAARRSWKTIALALVVAVPLVAYLVAFSSTRTVQGSTASRLALTRFSLALFAEHPVLGAGAGTFVGRLGQAREFTDSFGEPIDAHGFGQKILAEQGLLGIAAFLWLLGGIALALRRGVRALPAGSADRRIALLLSLAAVGMMLYEGFNTTYYSAKLWLPVGLALCGIAVLRRRQPTVAAR